MSTRPAVRQHGRYKRSRKRQSSTQSQMSQTEMPVELLRTALAREGPKWRRAASALPVPEGQHRLGDAPRLASLSAAQLRWVENACGLNGKDWSLEEIQSLLLYLLSEPTSRLQHVWSRSARRWCATAICSRLVDLQNNPELSGKLNPPAIARAIKQSWNVPTAHALYTLLAAITNARQVRGIYKLPIEILQQIVEDVQYQLVITQASDMGRGEATLLDHEFTMPTKSLENLSMVNSIFHDLCGPGRWACLDCRSRPTKHLQRVASVVKRRGLHIKYLRICLQDSRFGCLSSKEARSPLRAKSNHRASLFVSYLKHTPRLQGLEVELVPGRVQDWVPRLQRFDSPLPVRILQLAFTTNQNDPDESLAWQDVLDLIHCFPNLQHIIFYPRLEDGRTYEDTVSHLVADSIARQCQTATFKDVDGLFTDSAMLPLLEPHAHPASSGALNKKSTTPEHYQLRELTLEYAGSHMTLGWSLPMFANLTHLTLVATYDGHFGMEFLSQPFPALPSLQFLSFDTGNWEDFIGYFRNWPFTELHLGSIECLAPHDLYESAAVMRYPFDRVQKLRILPGSLFSYEELEFLEDDFAETKIVIDVEEALQDAFDEDDMDSDESYFYGDEDDYGEVDYDSAGYEDDELSGMLSRALASAVYSGMPIGTDFDDTWGTDYSNDEVDEDFF